MNTEVARIVREPGEREQRRKEDQDGERHRPRYADKVVERGVMPDPAVQPCPPEDDGADQGED